jgi:hypothetical protein
MGSDEDDGEDDEDDDDEALLTLAALGAEPDEDEEDEDEDEDEEEEGGDAASVMTADEDAFDVTEAFDEGMCSAAPSLKVLSGLGSGLTLITRTQFSHESV